MADRKSPDNPSAFRFVLSSSRSGRKADFHFQSIRLASEIRSLHLQIPGNLIRVSTGFQFHSPYFPFSELAALRFLLSVRFRRFTLENLKQKTRDFSLAVVHYQSEIQFIQRETYPPSSNLLIPLFSLMVAEADFKLRGSGNLRGSDLTDLLYHH